MAAARGTPRTDRCHAIVLRMHPRWPVLLLVASCHQPQALHAPAVVPNAPVVARVEVAGPPPALDTDLAGRSSVLAAVGPKSVGTRGRGDRWTQPFVHFARPMTVDATALHFEFEPRIKGETVWIDPYRAYFTPSDGFELGRHYQVHVTGKVQRDDGTSVALDERWAFDTRPPVVTLDVAGGQPQWWGDETPESEVHWRTGVAIGSEQALTAKGLRGHVTARAWPVGSTAAAARPIPVKVFDAGRTHGLPEEFETPSSDSIHVHPVSRWPADHIVEVQLDGRFAPRDAGPIGTPVVRRFRISKGTEVQVSCSQDFGDGCGPGGVGLSFSSPMVARDLARVRVTPRPKDLDVRVDSNQAITIYGDFVIDRSYQIELPKGMRDRIGQPLLGALRRDVAFVPPPPAVDLVVTSGVLRPGLPATVGLESRWVRKALLRAAVPSERAWIELGRSDLGKVPFPTDVTGLIEREIDLAPGGRYSWSSMALDIAALAGGQRPLLIEVLPLEVLDVAKHRREPTPSRGLFQVTAHGLAVWTSPAASRIWVRDNASLEASAGVVVEILDAAGKRVLQRVTDKAGFADLLSDRALPPRATVVTRSAGGLALVQIGEDEQDADARANSWRDRGEDRWISEVVTERGLYRPGETVSIVGWAAVSTTRTAHGLLRPKAGAPVELELLDRNGDVVARQRVAITRHGKYWGRLALPEHGSLGHYSARAKLPERGRGLSHMAAAEVDASFEVRDVEVPVFEVRTSTQDANVVRPSAVGIVAHASYYFGGAVPVAKERSTSGCSRGMGTVPGLDGGWQLARPEFNDEPWSWPLAARSTLGPVGEVRYELDTAALPPGIDLVCDTDLAVQDASFTEVGASERWYVHPSRYIVARALPSTASHTVEVRAVDPDGKARVAQRVVVEMSKFEDQRTASGTVEARPVRVHRCAIDTTLEGADARCTTAKLKPGRYRTMVTATIDTRAVSHEEQWWISEPVKALPDPPRSEPTGLELHFNATRPAPGTSLEVSMIGPKISGPGVLAFSHGGLRRLIPFDFRDGAAALTLPVTDAWVPEVEFSAFVVTRGATERDPPQTWRDSAHIYVDSEHRRLGVTIEAPATAGAGDTVAITVGVRGADGKPVDGRVALWAVDEAIHAMVPPQIPDFVRTFARGRDVENGFIETFSDVLRPYIVRGDPFEDGTYEHYGSGSGSGSAHGAGGLGVAGGQSVRRRFEATPIFVGDAAIVGGVAKIEGTMPENLTTFRLTAIASTDGQAGPGLARFGHNDARIQLTAPLVVRPAMPRMLRPGDQAELAILVDNLAGGDGKLSIAVEVTRGAELIEIVQPPQSSATMASGAQQRFPFTVRATRPGIVEFELRAKLDGKAMVSDAMRTTLPIEAASTLRRHAAAYGSLTQTGAFAIALEQPKDAIGGALAVDVELNGTMLGDLQTIARDLVEYPYGCVEQTTSGLLPLAALEDLAHQGYLEVGVRAHVDVGLARLRSMQVSGGGLGYWPGATRVHVWGTAYALWVLEALVAAGHDVPSSLREGLRDDLLARLGQPARDGEEATSVQLDDVAATMAVHALVTAGVRPTATIERLFLIRDQLPTFARALLLLAAHGLDPLDPKGAIVTSLANDLRGQLDERAGTVSVRAFGTDYAEYFDSSARTHALVMLALQQVDPDDPVIEKLARGLAIHRGEGRIANTQERAYTLLALAQYARHREKTVPALDATVWLGGTRTDSAKFTGRMPAGVRRQGSLAVGKTEPRVTIERQGKGRLYYRVGMSWAPANAGKVPASHGFSLARRLRTTSGQAEAIAAGDLVAMDVVITVDRMQRYVAIDVPLPPGLEAVDTSLGKGGRARVLSGGRSQWVSHQELRRDKAVIFADALSPGEHTTTVFLRAIAAGSYDLPPAEAHAMYAPELRGNTARARVDIGARR